jgi:hypothetical protein
MHAPAMLAHGGGVINAVVFMIVAVGGAVCCLIGAAVSYCSKTKRAKLKASLFVLGSVLCGVLAWRVDDVAALLHWY